MVDYKQAPVATTIILNTYLLLHSSHPKVIMVTVRQRVNLAAKGVIIGKLQYAVRTRSQTTISLKP